MLAHDHAVHACTHTCPPEGGRSPQRPAATPGLQCGINGGIIKRLWPGGDAAESQAQAPPTVAGATPTPASGSLSVSSTLNTIMRFDAPTVRNVRRGSATDALSAYRQLGAEVLIDELRQDRIAKSAVASAGSLITTWRYLHLRVGRQGLAHTRLIPMGPTARPQEVMGNPQRATWSWPSTSELQLFFFKTFAAAANLGTSRSRWSPTSGSAGVARRAVLTEGGGSPHCIIMAMSTRC